MGLDAEVGTVTPGQRADLVVANGRRYDPVALWRSVGFRPRAHALPNDTLQPTSGLRNAGYARILW